ncbi:MAG: undecaprenyl-diphosphate phosphatase [Planctomycetota bacterium]
MGGTLVASLGPPLTELVLQQAADAAASGGEGTPTVGAVFALAVVQGLTEFLPVSSSGHLALGRSLLDANAGGLALDVALHVGTLLAIVVAFRRDVVRLFRDLFAGRLATWLWLVVATLPAVVVGFTLKDTVEEAATSVTAAGCGLFVTAAFLLVGERSRRRHEASHPAEPPAPGSAPTLRWGDAIAMGLAQAAAIWPGVSRSGSTISTGLARGLPAAEAARLSFLMSLPAISGAAVLELPGALEEGFGGLSAGVVLAAAAVAGLVGWAALTTLLLVLRRGSFPYFAAYCAVLGVLALTVLR